MRVLLCIWFTLAFLSSTAQYERLFKLTAPGITRDTLHTRVRHDLEFLNLSQGDTVADIGSYDGYYPAMYSVFSDSVVFYLEDISPDSFTGFDSIKTLCEHLSYKKFTNVFHFCRGTDLSTNLPSKRFNKVLIRDAFHHFENKAIMFSEIQRVLKPDGQLILFEPLLPDKGANQSLCEGAIREEELLGLMKQNGFVLARCFKGKNDHWWFEFRQE